VLERLRPTRRRPRRSRAARSPRATTRRTSTRVVAWGLVAASLALAVEGLLQVGQLRFEYDFGKLGPKRPGDPTDPGPDYRDAVGKTSTRGPAAALCDRERDCEQITRLLESVLLLDNEELQRLRPSFPDAPSDRCRGGTCVRQRTRASAAPEDDEDEDRLPPSDPFYKLQQALDGGRLLPQQRERLVALGWKRVNEMVTFLRGFLGLHVFLPAYQPLKLQIIADIRRRIDAKRWALSKDSRRQIGRWYHYLTVRQPITRDDLPPWLIRQLQQADGRVGRYLIVWNSGSKKDYAVAKRLYRAFFNLPTAGAKTVPLAANYFVLVEVMDTLKADAPVVVGACGAAVLVVLLLMFRSLRAALLVLSPLLFAGAWLLGLFVVLHWKLNLFSVVSLPLLIGMALDDGIHVYHRWQHERRVWTVLREVGGPITLTTLTTMIGFAGLLFADHVGVQTLGLTAATGMALALVAAAITLPALLYVLER